MDSATRTHTTDAATHTPSAAERLFAGSGAARALARSLDWASTPLGPVDTWPQSLRTAASACLSSQFPTALFWGPALVTIHNDAHIPILGTEAMGRSAPEVMRDTWPTLKSLVTNALEQRDGPDDSALTDLAVTFDRGGGKCTTFLTVSVGAVRDEDGRPAGVMIVAADVTARVGTEAALRESEARFRAMADLVPDLLWESATDASPSWHNARSLEYTGRALAEAKGWGWTDTTHPKDRPYTAALYREARLRGRPFDHELRIRRHDGEYRWFHVRVQPMRDASGRIARWFGAATDVHVQRMLREEADRLAAERTRERDVLRRQLLLAEEDERRRLARELHDEAGQHLTALGLGLQALSDVSPAGSEVDRRAGELRALVDTMGHELHELAVRLRPKALDDFGLEAALAAYAEEWSRRTGIAVDVHADAQADRLPSAIESTIYRIVQEALTNVARHSGAKRASIVVERRDGHVQAIVEDDGRGMSTPTLTLERMRIAEHSGGGLGLLGIRERVELLDGTVDIESTPGGSTTLFTRIPIGALAAGRAPRPERIDD